MKLQIIVGLIACILLGTHVYYHNQAGWIRIYGYGIHFKNNKVHRPYFSERNGYVKYLKVGSWRIGWLKP